MATKSEIRSIIKSLKKGLSEEEKILSAQKVADRLLSMAILGESKKNVLLYNSLPDEISTHSFLDKYSKIYNFFLPRVEGNNLRLLAYQSNNDLIKGAFNIYEPPGDKIVDPAIIELAIIPGVAFDYKGNRIGRGKGFYDRLLPFLSCPLIGIGYDFQLLEEVPTEEHDIKMDIVITPNNLIIT